MLHDVSLHLAAGEYIAVMGESGAGKSTLLNLIAGLDVPDSGRIVVAGHDMAALDDAERTRLRRARMGFVFQAFHLLPHLSVARNVGCRSRSTGGDADRPRASQEMLAAVGHARSADDLPNQLSGGEMQRVAIARALAHRPSLVLADEPTGNLDAERPRPKCSRSCARSSSATTRRDPRHAFRSRGGDGADRVYRLTHQGLHERPALTMQAWPLIDAALTGPLRRSPGRNALLVVAIALGVALGFRDLPDQPLRGRRSSLAARSLYGLADLAIEGRRRPRRESVSARRRAFTAWQSRVPSSKWRPGSRIAAAR